MLLLRGKPGKTSCCFLLKDFGFSSLKRLVGDARGSLVLAEAGAAFCKKKKQVQAVPQLPCLWLGGLQEEVSTCSWSEALQGLCGD